MTRRSMAKTPGQPKRGKGGRFVADSEPASEDQKAEESAEENDWSRGEGFGSVGPAAFGTPSRFLGWSDDGQAEALPPLTLSGLRGSSNNDGHESGRVHDLLVSVPRRTQSKAISSRYSGGVFVCQ